MKKLFYAALGAVALSLIANAETRSPKSDIYSNLQIFNSVMKELQSNYVDTINVEEAVQTAIGAMLDKLDPYTEYMPRKEQEEFRSLNSGEYGGIGSYIMARNGNVYISGPHKGSPADSAGLRSGDLIMMVDTTTTLGMTTEQVSARLKGQRGTPVKVTVKRPYVTDSIITVEMVRDKIQIPAVPYSGMVADGIGYIQLSQFSEKSDTEVLDALNKLMEQGNLKGLIFDLRENGGGLLESAVKILGYFLPKGTEVLRTRGKGVMDERVYKTSSKPVAPDLPLVILTDQGTASASEITAGALQDLDRAVIMGSRSFGKGLVQSTREIPYDGLLKVTVARYYIPSGRLIQAIDYSHRNPDGTVARIPDSLTNVFTTAGGRTVRDGGGITPDIKVEYPEISRITYNVVRDNWAFDYANKYAATHPTLPPAGEFTMTDSIYADFKAFIDPARFNYDKVCETMLKNLREAAKIEGYMNDSISSQIDRLEAMMKHPLDKDLDTHRKSIEPYLEREIVNRYYYQAGEVENFLRHDNAVDSAVNLLKDPARYKALLSPVAATKKSKTKK
ncbi:MAG: S41 family peptidase [Firmicutes bacterium]|nr:S41 family peptidase [Bacillota bacterium]MCM1400468.1 S41 family peptidase [Bacteroides sp.]MCM1477439.1 S41 family peptidase [Bacteroides sp.]